MYTGIHGQLLEITVVGCTDLKDKEWLSRQDPYVIVQYASNRLRTRTHTDGGRHPSFNDKFTLSLVEGLAECNLQAWNSNTVTADDLIGSGRVNLAKVLSSGYDDNTWPLSTGNGRHAGYVRLIMHYKPLTGASSTGHGGGKVGKVGKDEHGHGHGHGHGTSGYLPSGYPPGYSAPSYPPTQHSVPSAGYPPFQGPFGAPVCKPADSHAAAYSHQQSAPYGYHQTPPPTHGFYQQPVSFAFPAAPAPVIPAGYPTAPYGSHGHYGSYSYGKHKEGKKKKKGKK